MSAIATAAN